ncbi:hypothetical protein ACFWZR_03905 [Streptomyces sp. NPDC059017]|uniref:hypothetical protein n=2 Tax=unclassified Streptomyces TaxID=2593676 RepID=UPI0036CC5E27
MISATRSAVAASGALLPLPASTTAAAASAGAREARTVPWCAGYGTATAQGVRWIEQLGTAVLSAERHFRARRVRPTNKEMNMTAIDINDLDDTIAKAYGELRGAINSHSEKSIHMYSTALQALVELRRQTVTEK